MYDEKVTTLPGVSSLAIFPVSPGKKGRVMF
jgi:hypothetical protein